MSQFSRRDLWAMGPALGLTACAAGASSTGARPQLLVEPERGPDEEIDLWLDGAPGGEGVDLQERIVERDHPSGLRNRAAFDITNPSLSVFRAPQPNGAAVLIIPGGGYRLVVVDNEGFESARYFNQFGVTAYVLKYRLPHQGWDAGSDTPLQDAQRALRLVRARAEADGIDPAQIMVMGFSAGGHLTGSLCQRYDAAVYERGDEADALSARPGLGVLVYPVALMAEPHAHEGSRINLIGEQATGEAYQAYDLTSAPNPEGPPLFLLHALDDGAVPVENTLQLASAARRVGLPAAVHVFDEGGHGFGLRVEENAPVAIWPQLVLDWARARGFGS